jgi:transcriptional regulator with XRE-family HTH domain
MPKKKQEDNRCVLLGQNIKKLRERKALTQDELSERANIHISYIGQIERGLRYPSLKILFRIADALEVKITDLFEGINAKKNR